MSHFRHFRAAAREALDALASLDGGAAAVPGCHRGFAREAADIRWIVRDDATVRPQQAPEFLRHVLCRIGGEDLPRR